MKKVETKSLIIKSNYLIEAPCRLTITEQKIVYTILKMIHVQDADFKDYEFRIDDFIKDLGLRGQSAYSELKKITRLLRTRTFTVKFNDKKIIEMMNGITEIQTGWISSTSYKEGQGIVIFNLDPKLKPFLLKLKEKFTELDFNNLKQLKSTYSTQLYELLYQYKKIGERKFNLNDIKVLLSIPENEYKLYAHFKSRVIIPAQKELKEKTDLSFDFEEIKESRKIVAIRFIIYTKPQDIENKLVEAHTTLDPVLDIKTEFKNLYKGDLHTNVIQSMIDSKGLEHIKSVLSTFKDYIGQVPINYIERFFYRCVMDDYGKSTSYIPKPAYMNFDQREYTDEYWEEILKRNQEKYTNSHEPEVKMEVDEFDKLTPDELKEKLRELTYKNKI